MSHAVLLLRHASHLSQFVISIASDGIPRNLDNPTYGNGLAAFGEPGPASWLESGVADSRCDIAVPVELAGMWWTDDVGFACVRC